jgi:hypothetical protein
MSTNTQKPMSLKDSGQVLKSALNDIDNSLSTSGFLTGKIGRKITQAITTTTITDDTEVFTFLETGTVLYALTIVYTDGTRTLMLSAERTA